MRRAFALLAVALACSCSTPAREDEPACADEVLDVSTTTEEEIAAMRKEGPEALARLLAEYDASEGAERERLAALVDRVAGQRYATVSRLYWYTDLEAAQSAARASGKPILSLRMLGRLDEDRSCANSRFFRVALYGNAELSRWLDENFVLHWSSERAVPKLTIDYGDGRRIETTIAGNSAHWVLDADLRVLDVVPGLMTPQAFRGELEGSLWLAARLDRTNEPMRVIAQYHQARAETAAREWGAIAAAGVRRDAPPIMDAERITMSKMAVERPAIEIATLGPSPTAIATDSELWPAIGERLLAARGLPTTTDAVLDAQSRQLMATLRPIDWSSSKPLDEAGRARLADAFAKSIVADTGLDLARLRPQIHAELARRAQTDAPLDRIALNEWLYETVFLTPASDRWLGLATPNVFTGLPGDGVTTAG
jgi:hypothetical protein